MKAFIFDPLWDELITDELQKKIEASGLELLVTKEIAPLSESKSLFAGDEEKILCVNPDYVNWNLSSDDYKDIPNLKAILTASTGFEWVEKEAAKKLGIPICNVVNFNAQSVAEWAIMMMLNLARQTPRLIKNGFPLDFDKDYMKYRGVELKGKTVGIIGLGNIGEAIAERAQGLGMKVIYWSKSPKQNSYQLKELDELFKTADVIFPTMAKNEETLSIITESLIQSMKPSAMIVDIAHGLFKKELVLEMVANGMLFGFGFEDKKPANFNQYKGNIWAAPEYAWATDKSMQNCMTKWVENMVSAAQGKFPNNVISRDSERERERAY